MNYTKQNAGNLYRQLTEQTEATYLKAIFTRKKKPSVYDSKIGGCPYWDDSRPWPAADNGTPLMMLAQVNLGLVPPDKRLPGTGMLQFFIYPAYPHKKAYAVVHNPLKGSPIPEEELLRRGLPISTRIPAGAGWESPVVGELSLIFHNAEAAMSGMDYRFPEKIRKIAESANIRLPDDFDWLDLTKDLSKTKSDAWFDSMYDTKLFGYPHFCQQDPRTYADAGCKNMELLFQISPEKNCCGSVMFADDGICHFWISPDDLKAHDFSRVKFTWECD